MECYDTIKEAASLIDTAKGLGGAALMAAAPDHIQTTIRNVAGNIKNLGVPNTAKLVRQNVTGTVGKIIGKKPEIASSKVVSNIAGKVKDNIVHQNLFKLNPGKVFEGPVSPYKNPFATATV